MYLNPTGFIVVVGVVVVVVDVVVVGSTGVGLLAHAAKQNVININNIYLCIITSVIEFRSMQYKNSNSFYNNIYHTDLFVPNGTHEGEYFNGGIDAYAVVNSIHARKKKAKTVRAEPIRVALFVFYFIYVRLNLILHFFCPKEKNNRYNGGSQAEYRNADI